MFYSLPEKLKIPKERLILDKNLFGIYLTQKRQEKGFTLRELASLVNISHTYLFNIENGLKSPPNDKLLLELADALELSENAKRIWFDVSAKTKYFFDKSNYHLPTDILKYLSDCGSACDMIKKANELNITDEIWNKILKEIKKYVP